MTHESLSQAKYHSIPVGEACLYIAGGSATERSLYPVRHTLTPLYGETNFAVYTSAREPQAVKPERFEEIGRKLKTWITDGRLVSVVTHSFGAVTLYKAIEAVEKDDPEFFNEPSHASAIDLIAISPSGFLTGDGKKKKWLSRFQQHVRQEQTFPLSQKYHPMRGVVSLNTFPPENIDHTDLGQAVRQILSDRSHVENDTAVVVYKPDMNYDQFLPADIKKRKNERDVELANAIEHDNRDNIGWVLAKRGGFLRDAIGDAYSGAYFPEPDTHGGHERWTPQALASLLSITRDMLDGKPLIKLRELYEKGMGVQFLIPEYDIFLAPEEVNAFFGERTGKQDVQMVSLATHSAPFILQPGIVKDVLFERRKQRQHG